jgi:hypothetical protein
LLLEKGQIKTANEIDSYPHFGRISQVKQEKVSAQM